MESKGRIKAVQRDFISRKYQLIIEVDTLNPEENMDGEKRITVKNWREKRSLDANAYMWALLEKLAVELGTTKDELYEDFIQKHGLMDRDDSGYITVTMRADIDPSHLPGHWKLDGEHSTIMWKVYRRIRGTSEYDTKEMSYFLDRVIEAAKEAGVETMTPAELERLRGYERQRTYG